MRHRVIAVSRVATNAGFGLGGGLGGLVAAHGLAGLVALFLGNAASYLLYVAVLATAVTAEPPAEPMPGGYRHVLRDGACPKRSAARRPRRGPHQTPRDHAAGRS